MRPSFAHQALPLLLACLTWAGCDDGATDGVGGSSGSGGIAAAGGSAGKGGMAAVGGSAGAGGASADAGVACRDVGCDDANECTTDGECDEATGVCPQPSALPDGTPCGAGECLAGSCEDVGNICPSNTTLVAAPKSVLIATALNALPAIDISFRAHDPDEGCGEQCAELCDDAEPPNCAPYPSTMLDPVCNPTFGGDLEDASCLSGERAGLVCVLAATATASGEPTGTFPISWLGPVLPVNLDADFIIPLPGLGGPIDGFPPRLLYECPQDGPGEIAMDLHCSDGDTGCDQTAQVTVSCAVGDFCLSDPRDCNGSSDCGSDGVCDPGCPTVCDPSFPQYDSELCESLTGVPGETCDGSPGKDDMPLPFGTPCESNGGAFCNGVGACVTTEACVDDADCQARFPSTECMTPATCSPVSSTCLLGEPKPYRTDCSAGFCDWSGECVAWCTSYEECSPLVCIQDIGACGCAELEGVWSPPIFEFVNFDSFFEMACKTNVLSETELVSFLLRVDPTPCVVGGTTGNYWAEVWGRLPDDLLDALQSTVPGGVKRLELVDTSATIHVRSGATTGDVAVGPAFVPANCYVDGVACDPANDAPDGSNPACVSTGATNRCGRFIDISTSSSCAPGGLCDALDGGDGVENGQCAANGFCVTHMPSIFFGEVVVEYTADPSGQLLFGFDDQSTGASIKPDGTYDLPQADPQVPIASNGFRIRTGDGTDIGVECTMAVDSNGPDGVGVPGGASPTPDSLLIAIPIQDP